MWELDLRLGHLEKNIYWCPDAYFNLPKVEDAEAMEMAGKTFSNIITNYMRSPYILCLTGGWDTRTIISFVEKEHAPEKCITFGLTGKSTDCTIARRICRIYDIPHEFILCDRDLLNNFAEYAEKAIFIADGMGDISMCDILFIFEKIRNQICVTGKYGTQVFMDCSRAVAFTRTLEGIFDAISVDFCTVPESYARDRLEHLLKPYADARFVQDAYLLLSLTEEIPRYWGDAFALESATNLIRSPYIDNKWVECLMRFHPCVRSTRKIQNYIICRHNRRMAGIPTDKGGLPMAANPWSVIQALFYKTKSFATQVVNSRRLSPYLQLDNTTLARNMNKNFNHWLCGPLGPFVRNVLLDGRTLSRGTYNNTKVETMINDHMSRQKDYSLELQKLISFELSMRTLVDKQPYKPPDAGLKQNLANITVV